jgi:hypothetical protein
MSMLNILVRALQDVVETLIGDEILDETDRYVDNERTQRVDSLELPERLRVRGSGGKGRGGHCSCM